MKLVAASMLAAIFGAFFLQSILVESDRITDERFQLPDLGPVEARPPAQNSVFVNESHQKTNLQSLIGSVVHLNFWASWCSPCLQELAILEKMKSDMPSNYRLILVNMDKDEAGRNLAKEWLKTAAPSLISYFDKDHLIANQWVVEALPQHVIIDKKGRVALAFVKAIENDVAVLKEKINKLLIESTD